MKIGLLGGSFDPIHKGHIELAKQARKEFGLSEVWFLVSYDQPLKEDHIESFEIRMELCEASIKSYGYLKVCGIEAELETPSYTYHTVKYLQNRYPDDEFIFIIGDDQYQQLDQWYQIEELQTMIDFLVVNRNDVPVSNMKTMIFNHSASSTAIRQGYFKHLPTPAKVLIMENGYYFPHILYQRLSEKRADHVMECVQVALEIADYHHVDITKVFLATILHDIGKEIPVKEQEVIMKKEFPDKLHLHPKIWHQFVGAFLAKQDFKINDKDVLKAIASHTTGDDRSILGMIVYCADKLERTRPYEVENLIELCKQNIYQGFDKVSQLAEEARKGD